MRSMRKQSCVVYIVFALFVLCVFTLHRVHFFLSYPPDHTRANRKGIIRRDGDVEQAPPLNNVAFVENIITSAPSPPLAIPIDFIPIEDLQILDIFAASWWQSVPRFLELNVTKYVQTVEDDAFAPILKAGRGFKDARMTRDWLDFSVEHLSKWWKLLGTYGINFAIGKLQAYYMHRQSSSTKNTIMNTTVAVIPYGVDTDSPRVQQMWTASLTATIASLLQHGIGRVVVVGYFDADSKLVRRAFRELLRYQEEQKDERSFQDHDSTTSFSTKVGATELAFVHTSDVKSKFIEINVPYGALKGLHQAFSGAIRPYEWLGRSPAKYKYIFLTEADQTLNARPTPYFTKVMDEGCIVIPHRLQPIPHSLDVAGVVLDTHRVIPRNLAQVHELNADVDSCCDTSERLKKDPPECGPFWWMCWIGKSRDYSVLEGYEFMRLHQGTGIVSLAATEHSRKCIPTKKKRGCYQGHPEK